MIKRFMASICVHLNVCRAVLLFFRRRKLSTNKFQSTTTRECGGRWIGGMMNVEHTKKRFMILIICDVPFFFYFSVILSLLIEKLFSFTFFCPAAHIINTYTTLLCEREIKFLSLLFSMQLLRSENFLPGLTKFKIIHWNNRFIRFVLFFLRYFLSNPFTRLKNSIGSKMQNFLIYFHSFVLFFSTPHQSNQYNFLIFKQVKYREKRLNTKLREESFSFKMRSAVAMARAGKKIDYEEQKN
jgi:hypothetical protein